MTMYVEKKQKELDRTGMCVREGERDSSSVTEPGSALRVTYLEVPLSVDTEVMTEVKLLRLADMFLSSFFILR